MQTKKIFKTVFSQKLNGMKNLSEFAREISISRNSIQAWCEGKSMPSRENCIKLVANYGFEYSDFFIEAESKEAQDDVLN